MRAWESGPPARGPAWLSRLDLNLEVADVVLKVGSKREHCYQCISLSHSLPPILQVELSGRLGPEKELPKRLDGPELPRVKQKALWGYCGSMVASLAKSA